MNSDNGPQRDRRTPWMRWVLLGLLRRWKKNALSILTMSAGVSSAVVVLASAQSSTNSIADQFQEMGDSTVSASVPSSVAHWTILEERLQGMPNVIRGGVFEPMFNSDSGVVEVRSLSGGGTGQARLITATPAGMSAHSVVLIKGTMPTTASWSADPSVCVIGTALANELGVDVPGYIRVGSAVIRVVATVGDAGNSLAASQSLIVSPDIIGRLGVQDEDYLIAVRAAPALGKRVGAALPAQLAGAKAEAVRVSVPARADRIERSISGSVAQLVLILTLVTVVASAAIIGNTMLMAVIARRGEVGVELSMGASRMWVTRQFFVESAMLGSIGGYTGWAIGVAVSGALAWVAGYEMALPLVSWLLLLLGPAAGMLGGFIPAWRASKMDPASLLVS